MKSFSSLINYDASSQPAPISQEQHGSSRLVFNGPSAAELLRLRLQVAMYKVRTNQIHVPFVELHVEEDEDDDDEAEESSEDLPEANDIEAIVASRRGEAQQGARTKQISAPKLLPAPMLLPTAYSSRMLYQNNASLPSPPRVMRSPDRMISAVERSTPAKAGRQDEQELTSSAVKGHGAEALLGLRNAA